MARVVVSMSEPPERDFVPDLRPRISAEELLVAKGTQPFASVEELSSRYLIKDPELEDFLVSYRAERRQGFSETD